VKLMGIRAPARAVTQTRRGRGFRPSGMLPFGTMETPKITAYLKTTCGWSAGVRAVLAKYNLQ